jgi:hypothetical protein
MNNPTTTSAVARATGVIGLGGIALIHLLDSIGKFQETPYMGWLYVGLITAAVIVAGSLIHRESRVAWAAAAVLAVGAITGYCLTRTVGLPQAHGDIGNWTEPLGLASLFVEGCLTALSLYRLAALQAGGPAARQLQPAA